VGGDFLEGGLTVGLSYYASFKLTDDRIEGLPGQLVLGKNKVFALGPEVSLALARNGVLYGFLSQLPVGSVRTHDHAGRRVQHRRDIPN
jgi:hypothetical protein